MTRAFPAALGTGLFLLAAPADTEAQAKPDAPAAQTAQAPAQARNARLRVYLDCSGCFPEFLRDQIKFVDFVRQPQDADVHLLSSASDTGGAGRETVLRFVGRGRFVGHDEELKAVSLVADSESTRRDLILRTVQVGLLAFMAREGLPANVELDVPEAPAGGAQAHGRDRWNFWVFSVSGSADMNIEETQRDRSWNLDFGADRITEAWKITVGARFDKQTEEFDLDEDEPLTAIQHEREASWFVAKSFGPHWSFGVDGQAESTTFQNRTFGFTLAPAVEYSFFPYVDYATRQLRAQYSMGVWHARYEELTIYNQIRETRPAHEASITLERREPWGSLDASLEFSQFLHDLSKYRLELRGEGSFRIARGLSVDVDGSISRIRDQLSLPRRDATQEEVLLRLRELQSAYEISFDVGFTYSFGSIFNNIVNPRFGR